MGYIDSLPDCFVKADLLSHPSCSKFEYRGLTCYIRLLNAGCWAGYVVPPPGSKVADREYPAGALDSIHGGEIGLMGFKGGIGFDTVHLGDVGVIDLTGKTKEQIEEKCRRKHFWTFEETKAETQRLADLILNIG